MTFQHCTFCHGRGCLACEAERQKYEAAQTERIKTWRPPTEEDVSLAKSRLSTLQVDLPGPRMTEEELDIRLRIPPPVLVIKNEDLKQFTKELELANRFIGRDALQQIAKEAEGDPQKFQDLLLQKAEAFRIEQNKFHSKLHD